VLRTWCQAPNRYTLEGIAEKAARDVIGFSMTFLDNESSKEVDDKRVKLILAMEDLAQNQDLDLKNDVLALKLAINDAFTIIKGKYNETIQAKPDEQAKIMKAKQEGYGDELLTHNFTQALKHYFSDPSQIKNKTTFKDIRSKFNNLEGIVEIASQINPAKAATEITRKLDEQLPIDNYIYFRDRESRPSHMSAEDDKKLARKTLIDALEELKNRTTNASLINDISAFISTANASSVTFDQLDELVKNPNTIKQNSVYINFRRQRSGVY
jgi:hypothetical protein